MATGTFRWAIWWLFTLLNHNRVLACVQHCHVMIPMATASRYSPPSALSFAITKYLVDQKPVLLAGVLLAHGLVTRRQRRAPFVYKHGQQFSEEDAEEDSIDIESKEPFGKSPTEENLSSAMIATIGFYKHWISPLLPPACRFLPTCSQYGVQAISKFGPTKGVILTAWRLLRCSPLGGRGYDPPKWPPVPYTYSSY